MKNRSSPCGVFSHRITNFLHPFLQRLIFPSTFLSTTICPYLPSLYPPYLSVSLSNFISLSLCFLLVFLQIRFRLLDIYRQQCFFFYIALSFMYFLWIMFSSFSSLIDSFFYLSLYFLMQIFFFFHKPSSFYLFLALKVERKRIAFNFDCAIIAC